jgi:hypothetical protein
MENRFALLDMDDDEKPRKAAKPVKAAETAAAPAAKTRVAPGAPPAKAAEAAEAGGDPRLRHAGAPRGGGGGHHRGGGEAGAPAPRGREHDRHVSGTGRGKEMKKGGAGGANWGSAAAETHVHHVAESEAEVAAVAAEAAVEGLPSHGGAAGEEAAAAPEPDNSITFEEYQAKLAEARKGEAFAAVVRGARALCGAVVVGVCACVRARVCARACVCARAPARRRVASVCVV